MTNMRRLSVQLTMLVMACLSGTSLWAGEIQISLGGVLVEPPCDMSVENSDQTVDLETYIRRDLVGGGRTSGKSFYFDVRACASASKVKVALKGQEDTQLPGLLAIGGTASGVAIGIESADGDPMKVNGDGMVFPILGDVKNRLTFTSYIQSLKGRPVRAGLFSSVLNVEFSYP